MRSDSCKIISVYTGDSSGVCSALYELDGLLIIHDPSGCNSTYNTHDEPRWYDIPGRVYVSGLTEYEAILGDEDKFINDTVEACRELKPRFIAFGASPIPFAMGQDLKALGTIIERKTGVPTMAFETNGMHTYIDGAGKAMLGWAERFLQDKKKTIKNSVNILGVTPLDFPRPDIVNGLINAVESRGFTINSVWTMGDFTKNMEYSAEAEVNLVVSSVGIPVAKYMEKKYGIPYVTGVPLGEKQTDQIGSLLRAGHTDKIRREKTGCHTAIIGESIYSNSLANLIGPDCTVLTLLDDPSHCLLSEDIHCSGEEDLENHLKDFDEVIADPAFRGLVDSSKKFTELGHFAFSGRIYKNEIPDLSASKGDKWVKEIQNEK